MELTIHLLDMPIPLSGKRTRCADPPCVSVDFFSLDSPPPTARLVIEEVRASVAVVLEGQTTRQKTIRHVFVSQHVIE